MKRSLFCAIYLWSTLGLAGNPIYHLPVWELKRDGRASYIIGTPPINLNIRNLPPYYQVLIRSHPYFLTESRALRRDVSPAEHDKSLTEIGEQILANIRGDGKNRHLAEYLPPAKVKFVKRIARRIALSSTPRWKQIFIPGYAGIVAETAALISPFMPPLIVASAVITAATGIGLENGTSANDLLIRAAQAEKRKIMPLARGVDTSTMLKIIGPKQLQNVIDYVMEQQASHQPVGFVQALERMMSSIDSRSVAELVRRSHEEVIENVNRIVTAHENGGAIIAMDLLGLLSQSGHLQFDRLTSEGFTITRVVDTVSAASCQKLLK